MAYGDLKCRNLIWNTGSGDNTVVVADIPPKNNPTFTGTVTIPTAPASDVSTKAASTAFVDAYYATKAAPAFTGSATGVNLTLSGNLVVNGTTTTINTQTLDVEDKNISLGKVSNPSDTTADGGGITLLGSSNKTFNWVNATDAWTSSEHIYLGDNKKLLLGVGAGGVQDLSVYSNGSEGILETQSGGTIKLKCATGSSATDTFATFSGASSQIDFHKSVLFVGNTKNIVWDNPNDSLYFTDNAKIRLGAGSGVAGDLLLYSNGTEGILETPDGGTIKIKDGSNTMATFSGANNQLDIGVHTVFIGNSSNGYWSKANSQFGGNGGGLTHLNLGDSNNTGTVATARLGSGTANSGTFLAGNNTWQAISGAPQITATASGAITAGNPVVVNTNGSVSKIGLSYTAAGTPAFDTGGVSANISTGYTPIALYCASADRYAFLYRDGDNSRIVVGQLDSDRNLTLGSASGIINSSGNYSQIASMAIVPASEVSGTSNDVLAVVYRHYPGNNDGYFRLGTVNNNNTISLNSGHTDITSGDLFRNFMRSMGNGKILLAYANGSECKVLAIDVTGSNAFSIGSETTAVSSVGNANPVYISEPDSNGKAILVVMNNSSALKARAVSVSGTTVTLGTEVELASYALGVIRDCKVAYNKDDNNFLAVFTNNALQCVAMTISGTTITKSSTTPIQLSGSNIETRGIGVVYDSRLKHFWAHVSRDGNNNDPTNYYFPVTETGSGTPTIGTPKEHDFGTNLIDGLNSVFQEDDNAVVSVGRNTSSSNDLFVISAKMSSSASNLTAENFIGFANATANDTAQATIDVSGATNSSQSSLTAGQKYYVQPAGTIGLTPGSPAVFAGTAISATKILVNDQQTVPAVLGEVDEWGMFSSTVISGPFQTSDGQWGNTASSNEMGTLTRYSYSGMPIGTGLTHTNGVFTFPSTGKYEIQVKILCERYSSNVDPFEVRLELSTNGGSSWLSGINSDGLDQAWGSFSSNRPIYNTLCLQAILNVTDVSTYRLRVLFNSFNVRLYVRPTSRISFKKLG